MGNEKDTITGGSVLMGNDFLFVKASFCFLFVIPGATKTPREIHRIFFLARSIITVGGSHRSARGSYLAGLFLLKRGSGRLWDGMQGCGMRVIM